MQEMQETQVRSLGWEDPWRRTWQPTLIALPGESHGQRRLAGSSPQGHNELNMTEVTYHTTRRWADGQEHMDSIGIWLRQNRRRLSLKKEGVRT